MDWMKGTGPDGRSWGESVLDDVMHQFERPEAASDKGLSVEWVVQQLSSKYTATQVRNAIEELGQEGSLYSTIDENHFKSSMH
jgi:hypothetical protein